MLFLYYLALLDEYIEVVFTPIVYAFGKQIQKTPQALIPHTLPHLPTALAEIQGRRRSLGQFLYLLKHFHHIGGVQEHKQEMDILFEDNLVTVDGVLHNFNPLPGHFGR